MKNWRSRKIENAHPNHAGTVSGNSVLTQPNLLNRINVGISVTWKGTIMVARTRMNSTLLPRARKRAKP